MKAKRKERVREIGEENNLILKHLYFYIFIREKR